MRVHPPPAPESVDASTLNVPVAESWGARQMQVIALRWPLVIRLASLLRRYGAWLGPPLVVAATLIVMARVHYNAQLFGQGPGVAGFAEINRVSAKQLGIQNI